MANKNFNTCCQYGLSWQHAVMSPTMKEPINDSPLFQWQWNLVCAQSYKAGLVQSIFMAGVLVGAIAFGNFSDSRGRRSSLLICIIGMTAFGFISSFATSYIMYCVLRFAAGVLCGGVILVRRVIACKWRSPEYRHSWVLLVHQKGLKLRPSAQGHSFGFHSGSWGCCPIPVLSFTVDPIH